MAALAKAADVRMSAHESLQSAVSTSSIFNNKQQLSEIADLHILLGKARSVPFIAIPDGL